jgi:putative phosphoserine phosphatase/1-acylglycerol-3-phosphate O-acyltransferase
LETTDHRYVAFFDLDKTILSINSGSALVRGAYKRGLLSTADLLNAIYLSLLHKLHLRDTALIVTGMGRWLKGVSVDEVTELSEQVVKADLVRAIRPEMNSEIGFHKLNNAEIVILSSSIIQMCKPLGTHIGANDIICTEMDSVDGCFTGSAENRFCFEDEKRVRLVQYCKAKNYSLGEAWYYGDSIADLSALEAVGHPVCVYPDKKLSRIANIREWRVIS